MKKADNQLLVIFGASGDLTSRKLLPSLFELYVRGLLPDRFCILGAARTAYGDEEFRAEQHTHILEAQKGKTYDEGLIDDFLENVYYLAFDSTNADEYYKLRERIEFLQEKHDLPDKIIYYLATPPVMYEIVPQCLLESGLNKTESPDGFRRIIVEKPFGTSLESARQLNDHLRHIFHEEEIYRIDHYLGKETVQNILVLRFSNGIFEPLWNHNYIDSIEISATETLGVENRGKYYDGAGAMRDMIQNHLMQLMSFIAMESPSIFEPEPIRDEIVKVFRSIRPYTVLDMDKMVVRGQYIGYREEKNVASDSNTETYVAMKFFIDNWRWSGVPFYFYTGKKLPEKSSEVVIHFKSTPHQLFVGQCSGGSCNKLTIRIQPNESISLKFGLKMPGAGFEVKQVSMDFRYDSLSKSYLPDAYERLLLDAMLGDSTLYARSDALEASWKFIDPILLHWKEEGSKNLFFYEPGEDGPEETVILGAEKKSAPAKEDNFMEIKRYNERKEALRSMTEDMMAMIRRKDFAPFNLALSGGETAKHMFSLWVDEYKDKIDWNNIRFFWVDERCVLPTCPDSNYGHANHLLFKPLCIPADHIHRIKGENEPGTEAMRYSWVVKEFLPLFNQMPTFDCIILGVGEDSHTASIFPTTMELLSDSRNYAVSQQPSTGQYRITMTGPLILNGAPLLVPILGTNKEPVIQRLSKGYSPSNDTPAAYILSHAVQATIYGLNP